MLFLLFLLLPVLEIYIFIQAIDEFGFWIILGEVIFTAWLGLTVLKFRSLIVMGAIQKTLNKEKRPEVEMINSLLIFLGAIFLIVPGLITDAMGLLCLFSPTRYFIGMIMRRRLANMAQNGRFRMVFNKPSSSGFPPQGPGFGGMGHSQRGDIRDVGPSSDSAENNDEILFIEQDSHKNNN